MFYLYVDIEDVLEEYPLVSKWLDSCDNILGKPIEDKHLEVYYSYGYFNLNIKDIDSYYMYISKMKFDERLIYELSRIKVSLTLKRKKFILSNRLKKGFIPMYIKDIVTELTKVKMLVESEYHQNKEVIDSIPEVDTSIVSFKIIKEVVNNQGYSEDLDIDVILEKIYNDGMESLSDEEKEFLDKKSKDLE
jgi:hypothetical protein